MSSCTIHNKYWDIESDQERRNWMQNHITTEDPKRRYSDPASSKRKITCYFFLPNVTAKGQRIAVCQTMFLSTLGVSVRNAQICEECEECETLCLSPLIISVGVVGMCM